MYKPEQIIPDEEVARVHGNANFGPITPRSALDRAVLQYAFGFTTGHTAQMILVEHGLLKKPAPGRPASKLTTKGMKYLRAVAAPHMTAFIAMLTVEDQGETVQVPLRVVNETDTGYCVTQDAYSRSGTWIDKDKVQIPDLHEVKPTVTAIMPSWYADKRGLRAEGAGHAA